MPKPTERKFNVGDKIRVNLHHGKIEDAVVRAVIHDSDGLKLQTGFGHEQTALIDMWQVCRVRLLRSNLRIALRQHRSAREKLKFN